jgi:hypothetical protein
MCAKSSVKIYLGIEKHRRLDHRVGIYATVVNVLKDLFDVLIGEIDVMDRAEPLANQLFFSVSGAPTSRQDASQSAGRDPRQCKAPV